MGLSYCYIFVQAKPRALVMGPGSSGTDYPLIPSCLIKALGQFYLLRSKTRLKLLSDPVPSSDHKSPNTGAGSPGRPVGPEHLRYKQGCELRDSGSLGSQSGLSGMLSGLSSERTSWQRSTIKATGVAATTTPALVRRHVGNLSNINYVLLSFLR